MTFEEKDRKTLKYIKDNMMRKGSSPFVTKPIEEVVPEEKVDALILEMRRQYEILRDDMAIPMGGRHCKILAETEGFEENVVIPEYVGENLELKRELESKGFICESNVCQRCNFGVNAFRFDIDSCFAENTIEF